MTGLMPEENTSKKGLSILAMAILRYQAIFFYILIKK